MEEFLLKWKVEYTEKIAASVWFSKWLVFEIQTKTFWKDKSLISTKKQDRHNGRKGEGVDWQIEKYSVKIDEGL